MATRLTGTGIWSSALRYGDASEAAEAAAELEELGYRALWIPDVGGDVFGPIANLLAATRTATVATGILNIWLHPATETAAQHAALTEEHGERFLVGLGVSHAHLIDRVLDAGTYRRPLAQMRAYLDDLDRADPPLPAEARVLAALGPKMLQLARERSAGVHPYLVTPEHTALARAAIGGEGLVAPEQGVVREADPGRAREIGRAHLARYLEAPNYTNSWRRLGFTEDDLAGGGSDRLVDALVAWGDDAALAARVQAHRDAGADHVCIQVLGDEPRRLTSHAWRELAPALI
jgi:probable F420-dependent oxidoreductase